jgi:ornithine cyclodeaminase/alanine dehydrogenase-like protein (mu-crystallin family)
MQLRLLDADTLESCVSLPHLIQALRLAFAGSLEAPARSHYTIGQNSLLVMPAWDPGEYTGAKLVTIHRGNRERGLPTIHGLYVLFDGASGVPKAVLDGRVLTLLRTGATSALAADHLARSDAKHHLVVGAGALAPYLVRSMAAIRPISRVSIWNRTVSRARELVAELRRDGVDAAVSDDLGESVGSADIISTATQSTEVLVRGEWLSPGVHLDLVGAYSPEMLEVDHQALAASRVFVDTWEGARAEAGDLIQAVARGAMEWCDVAGDMRDLVTSSVPSRESSEQITVFKSVGASIEDLAAATLAWESCQDS